MIHNFLSLLNIPCKTHVYQPDMRWSVLNRLEWNGWMFVASKRNRTPDKCAPYVSLSQEIGLAGVRFNSLMTQDVQYTGDP